MSWTGPAPTPKAEESESDKSETSFLMNRTPEKAATIPEANEEPGGEAKRSEQSTTESSLLTVQSMLKSSASVFVRSLNSSDESIGAKSPSTRTKTSLRTKKTSPSKGETTADSEKEVVIDPIPREQCILNFTQDDKAMDQQIINLMKVLIAERKYIFSVSSAMH